MLPALAARREVVAIDLPGFGQSAPLAGPTSIADLPDALAQRSSRPPRWVARNDSIAA